VILVDTSVWVDHLRSGKAALGRLLESGAVLGHPWVTGELCLGNLGRRSEVIWLLQGLPQAIVASDVEVLGFIDRESLSGAGIGCGVRRIRPPSSAESDHPDRLNPTTQFGVSDHLGEGLAAA
jgi:predicted nucleic acid-binding protein